MNAQTTDGLIPAPFGAFHPFANSSVETTSRGHRAGRSKRRRHKVAGPWDHFRPRFATRARQGGDVRRHPRATPNACVRTPPSSAPSVRRSRTRLPTRSGLVSDSGPSSKPRLISDRVDGQPAAPARPCTARATRFPRGAPARPSARDGTTREIVSAASTTNGAGAEKGIRRPAHRGNRGKTAALHHYAIPPQLWVARETEFRRDLPAGPRRRC